jgi:3-hydroxyacyl-CoA dehydrogenase / enoyl-CoA hydratase / 3-hydroxybutyryl-CoA epimerase / enoyl-CoA isomerase
MTSTIFQGQTLRVTTLAGGLAELCFDRAGEAINKLDLRALDELADALAAIAKAAPAPRGLLVTSAKDVFIVGADITEFGELFKRTTPELLARLRRSNAALTALQATAMPVVVAINGFALGGGLELALSGDYRVMSSTAQVGLPEVQLGLFPGLGGTARLPRVAGLQVAIDWIGDGKPRSAQAALAQGVVDELAEPQALREAAMAQLRRAMDDPAHWQQRRAAKQAGIAVAPEAARDLLAQAATKIERDSRPHEPAARSALAVIAAAWSLPCEAALEEELRGFVEVARAQAAASLIQAFLSEQWLKKQLKARAKKGRPVKAAAVLGAGVMGGGIAFTSAVRGVPVRLKDIDPAGLDIGWSEAGKLLARQVKAGRRTAAEADAVLATIVPQLDFAGFDRVDLVVEAVVENLDVKRRVLADLETRLRDDAVIASNTSSLRIEDIAASLKRPGQFVGMHFFNPVPVMPLVEIIQGRDTAAASVDAAVGYALAMGKTPIVVKDCPGFLVNRVLIAYTRAFSQIIADGADFERVDAAMEAFGWPMGPAYLMDVVGMDVGSHVAKVIAAGYPQRMTTPWSDVLSLMVEHGRFGQKTGTGFYRYEADASGRRVKRQAPDSASLISAVQPNGRRVFADEEIVERLMLPMIIEASIALDEGVVGSAAELDIALLLGIGFPRYAGGALRYADWLGIDQVVALSERHAHLGEPYRATPTLRRMAAAGHRFYPG